MDNLEELNARVNANDLDTINKIISGEAFTAPTVVEQPVVEEATVVEEEAKPDIDAMLLAERQKAEAMMKAKELELRAEMDRIANEKREAEAKAKEYEDYLKKKKEEEELKQYEIDESPEEQEFASSFEKNTRKKIELIEKKLLGGSDNEDIKELIALKNELKAMKDQQAAELARIKEEEESNKVRQIMYSEINEFQNRNERFRLGRPVEDARGDFGRFADQLQKYLKTEDTREVNKAIHAIAYADTAVAKQLRDRVAASPDVVIPSDLKQYLDLVQVVDAKNGIKFNRLTGETEPILDRFGNQVRYASVDEAYKVSRFYDELAQARMEGVRAVQEKLNTRHDSAVTLPTERVVDPSQHSDLSNDRINQLMSMPNSAFRDPKLKEELIAAYHKLGIPAPKI